MDTVWIAEDDCTIIGVFASLALAQTHIKEKYSPDQPLEWSPENEMRNKYICRAWTITKHVVLRKL